MASVLILILLGLGIVVGLALIGVGVVMRKQIPAAGVIAFIAVGALVLAPLLVILLTSALFVGTAVGKMP